ncbi:dynein intermediate chain 2, ciliary-like [Aphis craccivora]|uniref:Dynein axonemal intermediate chain 4 n=1 Tax=Aphis craccivora TaxID=307492 RepID=A0A6G0Y894_APHCR|nr:dynein intermediate chain 2, ciliary-like [Aphis craccivora]
MCIDMKKSRQNKPNDEIALKLVVTSIENDSYCSSIENQLLHQYEFYLGDTNVTPQEPIHIKYKTVQSNDDLLDQPIVSKIWTTTTHVEQEQEPEDHFDTFRHLSIKSLDNLLDNIFTKRQYHNGEISKQHKYDVGPNFLFPKNNTSNDHYEIELIESPPFNILNVPSSVTIKGDGDYEKLQNLKEIYLNNLAKSRDKVDNISQTINSLMEREHVECQTSNDITLTAGTQVHDFNIIDAYNEIDAKQNVITLPTIAEVSNDMENYDTDEEAEKSSSVTTMFLERILAQNSLDVKLFWSNDLEMTNYSNELPGQQIAFDLKYCFTLKLFGDADKGIAVRCMHWNETEKQLLAVVYSKLMYTDYTGKQYASVAVWSTKNQHTPERFYEFNTSAITCIKFSTVSPNQLAIGFDCGKILIIDVSKKSLNILFQTSTELSLETTTISELFWTINIENKKIPYEIKSECLMACNTIGCISRYYFLRCKFVEQLIMKLSHIMIQDDHPEKNLDESKTFKPGFRITKFIELNQNADLIGTADGLVYSFSYDDLMTRPKKFVSHFGIIKSLEKSPFSQDVYLTTGCDCNINIWIGGYFLEPVIILSTGKQIEKAIWSRTRSTIIASIIDNCIHIWDISVTKYDPIFVQKMPNPHQKCSDIQFSPDGNHLCVSDISGKVMVYVLSNISPPDEYEEHYNLVYVIAKIIYGKKNFSDVLIKKNKEFAQAFNTVDFERYGRKFS